MQIMHLEIGELGVNPKHPLSGSFQGWLQVLEVYSKLCPNYSLATHIMQPSTFISILLCSRFCAHP
jgi:hypothetical protein